MRIYVCDWSVNKRSYNEFINFLVDLDFDVSINGFNVVAKNGKRTARMYKGFKCNRDMLALTRRFKND